MSFRYACLALVFAYAAVLATCAPTLPGDTSTPPANTPTTLPPSPDKGPYTTAATGDGELDSDDDDDDVQRILADLALPLAPDAGPAGTSAAPDPDQPDAGPAGTSTTPEPVSEAQLLFEHNLHDAVRTLKPLKPIPAPALQ